jgi:tRNA threonylcarbamoyladenosine biosynthesis protein TsaB
MDARRSQVYNALFQVKNGKISRISPDRAISLEDLEKDLQNYQGPVYLVGDGAALCNSRICGLILPPPWRQHQRAVGVGLAALKMIAAGENGDAAALTPNYLRLSQAERERLERGLSLK